MIKAPNWCKNAQISTRGWVDAETGELLVSRRFSRAEVEAYNAAQSLSPVVEEAKPAVLNEVMPEPVAEVLTEVPVYDLAEETDEVDFDAMSKRELETWAREEFGHELDRRKSKAALIAEVKEFM
jgi:hypothetical protein